MARFQNDDCPQVFFQQGSCKIILKLGDLFDEEDVDARVIPTPESGMNTDRTYPLFEALRSRTDRSLHTEIKKCSAKIQRHAPPQIISTVKPSIILTPIPYFRSEKAAFKLLRSTYTSCLHLAVEHNCRTIALPTIGCGNSGFQPRDAAEHLYKALLEFAQSSKKKLSEIRIVIYDKDIHNQFTNVFMDLGHNKNAEIKLIEIATSGSNPSKMPSREDKKQTSSANAETTHYEDDFEPDQPSHQHGDVKRQTSKLNPDSQEFQPQTKTQSSTTRHYRINKNRTDLIITQGDILKTKVDAIVNAANESMLGGSGVDGLIHKAAGSELLKACKAHKQIYHDVRLPTGRSRILLGYDMSRTTHYIINTAGPRYNDAPPDKCKADLTSCYETSLALANLYDLETIAYTAISCGIFDYPVDEAAEVALQTIARKADSMREIWFVLKEDKVYDAWVKKAEQLGFISLNDHEEPATSASTRPTNDENDESDTPKRKDDTKVTGTAAIMGVIDASTSKDGKKPPDGSPSNSNQQSHNEHKDTSKKKNKKPKEGDATETSKSDAKTSNSQEVDVEPNNSSEQGREQRDDEQFEATVSQHNTNKSIVTGNVGRGRGTTWKK